MLCIKLDRSYIEKIVTAVMPGVSDSLYIYSPLTLSLDSLEEEEKEKMKY